MGVLGGLILKRALPDFKIKLLGDVGVIITGTGISAWQDQSGNDYHFTQSVDAKRPDYIGGDTISMNKTNLDHLDGSSHISNFLSDNVGELFVIARRKTNSDFSFSLLIANSGTNTNKHFFIGGRSSTTPQSPNRIGITYIPISTTTLLADESQFIDESFYLMNLSSNGSRWRGSVDAAEVSWILKSGSNDGGWFADLSANTMSIGASLRDNPIYYGTEIKAILYIDRELTSNERLVTCNFLNDRFSVY